MPTKKRSRKRNKAAKGGAYEREICRGLSLWFSDGERDDIFWRSDSSGGRAKFRSRKGKDTFGRHGDIAPTDPIGLPLIQLFTIEVKRGYSGSSPHDILDMSEQSKVQTFDEWVEQTIESFDAAKSKSWAIISRRNRREAIISFPKVAYDRLRDAGAFGPEHRPIPFIEFRFLPYSGVSSLRLVQMRLSAFLKGVRPEQVQVALLMGDWS